MLQEKNILSFVSGNFTDLLTQAQTRHSSQRCDISSQSGRASGRRYIYSLRCHSRRHIRSHPDVIINGFRKAGIVDKEFQAPDNLVKGMVMIFIYKL